MKLSKNNKILALFTFAMLAFGDTGSKAGIGTTTIANWIDSTASAVRTKHDNQADSLLVAQTLVNQLTGNINSVVAKGVDTKQSALNTAFQLLLEEFKSLNQSEVDNTTIFNSLLSGLPNISTDAKNKAMVSAGLSSDNSSYNNNASTLQNFDLLNNSELNDATFSQLSGIGKGDISTINQLISQAAAPTTYSFGGISGGFGSLVNNPSATRISTVDQSITTGTPDAIWEESYLRVLKSIIQYGDLAQHGSSIKLTAIANLLAQAVGTKATELQQVQTIIAGLQAKSNGVRMYSSQEIMNALTGTNINTNSDVASFILNNTTLANDLDVSVRLRLAKRADTGTTVAGQVSDTINLLSSIISPTNRYNMDYIIREILSAYSTKPSAEIISIIMSQLLYNTYFLQNPADQTGNLSLIAHAFQKNGIDIQTTANSLMSLKNVFTAPDYDYDYLDGIPNGANAILTILYGAYTYDDISKWINNGGGSNEALGSFFPKNNTKTIDLIANYSDEYSNGIILYFSQYGTDTLTATNYLGQPFKYTYSIKIPYQYK